MDPKMQDMLKQADKLIDSVLMGDRKWHKVHGRSFQINEQGSFLFKDFNGDIIIGPVTALGGMLIKSADVAGLESAARKAQTDGN